MVDIGAGKKVSTPDPELPWAAIVGQPELKSALLAVGTNEDLGGLLVRGGKGTAKSTAARALADLLPEQEVVADCPFGCAPVDGPQCPACRDREDPPVESRPVPFVTLPLGATRDHVVGTLSVSDALEGEAELDPGLLARANRGILYVDEVNLLDDHLVDVLLDAAASGVNHVERDGVHVTHPADVTLVGTMNPEEGQLRPQFRDRFDLQVTVEGSDDVDDRLEILDRALGEVGDEYGAETAAARERLHAARERIGDVTIPDSLRKEIVTLCRDAGVDGHRGDIATARAARALAALDGRERVIEPDVVEAAEYALGHRLTSRPFEDERDPEEVIDEHFEDSDGEDSHEGREESEPGGDERPGESTGEESTEGERQESEDGDADGSEKAGREGKETSAGNATQEQDSPAETPQGTATSGTDAGEGGDGSDGGAESDDAGNEERAQPLVPGQSRPSVGEADAPEIDSDAVPDPDREDGTRGSRLSGTATVGGDGPRIRTEPAETSGEIDATASVRAAARRGSETVESRDLRQSVRETDAAALVVFVVDASSSMRPAMRAAKGTVLELLKDAYRQRDEVAFVAFAGEEAEVLLPPTDSVPLAARHLKQLPTGDRTPLPAGLRTAGEVLDRADPAAGIVVLVTDGRANVADGSPIRETRVAAGRLAERTTHTVVVDAGEDGHGVVDAVVEETDGEYIPLSALSADRIDATVGRTRES